LHLKSKVSWNEVQEVSEYYTSTVRIWSTRLTWYDLGQLVGTVKNYQFVSALELFKVTFNKRKSKMLSLTDYVWLKGLLFSFVHHINSNTCVPSPPEHLVLLVKVLDVDCWETVSCYRLKISSKFVWIPVKVRYSLSICKMWGNVTISDTYIFAEGVPLCLRT
jgi:hypothetical protein